MKGSRTRRRGRRDHSRVRRFDRRRWWYQWDEHGVRYDQWWHFRFNIGSDRDFGWCHFRINGHHRIRWILGFVRYLRLVSIFGLVVRFDDG